MLVELANLHVGAAKYHFKQEADGSLTLSVNMRNILEALMDHPDRVLQIWANERPLQVAWEEFQKSQK